MADSEPDDNHNEAVDEQHCESAEALADVQSNSDKMILLSVMDIQVVESEKRTYLTSMNMKDSFVAYLIECKITDPNFKGADARSSLWRRYSEFELLRDYLEINFPFIVIPPLPEKRVTYSWHKTTSDKYDPDFIDRRRNGLENFLLRVASHRYLCFNKVFMGFLQQEDDWKESFATSGFQAKGEGMLKMLNATYRLKKPDRKFDEMKSYSEELQSNISSLLKLRSKVVEKEYAIHKVHGNYGREFSQWSTFEKRMGDGLQTVGHYMDVYASSIDSLLDEEENFIDQIKDYYYFADAMKSVLRKEEFLQYEVEKAEENLSNKSLQKDQVVQGKAGLISRWFRAPDTDDMKETKIKNIDKQIQEAEVHLRLTSVELNSFIERALEDIERFKRQKLKDLKIALFSYIITQIKLCKKGINTWTNIRDCVDHM